jgi:RNA polymerase sigma-70 factor (ECF subfamily)
VGSQSTTRADAARVTPAAQPRLLFARELSFEMVYHAYFRQVVSWMRAMKVPATDMEDAAQEVFLIVRRKLPGFRGDNLAGWLYRIADYTARNYRRLAWFKHLFRREPHHEVADMWAMGGTPAITIEQREDQRTIAHMLARMSAKRRETLILFEVEGYSGQEIAVLQGVPIKTVWTRLHHARRDLVVMVAAARKRHEREAGHA